MEKEKDALRLELSKAKGQISEADAAIGAQKAELGRLKAVVAEADAERLRQRKEYEMVRARGGAAARTGSKPAQCRGRCLRTRRLV